MADKYFLRKIDETSVSVEPKNITIEPKDLMDKNMLKHVVNNIID